MKIEYSNDMKEAYFDGFKFRRDPKTGYYLSTKKVPQFGRRIRLHVYVWTKYNGPIPDGYQVHHKDQDKSHNEIDNLAMLEKHNHAKWHGSHLTEERKAQLRKNIQEKGVPAAKAWHHSEEGLEWHKQHYEQMGYKLHLKTKGVCAECGKPFVGISHQRFCSNKCKSAWRRDQHIDDEKRVCEECGRTFYTNKYQKKKFCCEECRRKNRAKGKQEGAGVQHVCGESA